VRRGVDMREVMCREKIQRGGSRDRREGEW
jgi:hypothetical protein